MITLEEIEAIHKDFLTPTDIADFIGCNPQSIRVQAYDDKSKSKDSFGFPISVIGTRVKIPKIPFIKFMRGEP